MIITFMITIGLRFEYHTIKLLSTGLIVLQVFRELSQDYYKLTYQNENIKVYYLYKFVCTLAATSNPTPI